MRPLRKHLLGAAAAAAVAIALAGGAAAYWTGSGGGTGQTRLPDVQTLILGPGTPSQAVSPGASASVAVVIRNPNDFFVHISTLELDDDGDVLYGVDSGHSGCDVAALSFTTQDNGGAGWDVPPKVGSDDGTLGVDMPDALAMDSTAADACQGAAFTVRLLADD